MSGMAAGGGRRRACAPIRALGEVTRTLTATYLIFGPFVCQYAVNKMMTRICVPFVLRANFASRRDRRSHRAS